MALDPIERGLAVSEQYLTSLASFVKNELEHSFIDHLPGADIIIRNIEAQIAKVETVLHAIGLQIKAQIEPLLKGAVPDAIAVVTSLARTLDDNLSRLVNNIATTEDVLGSAITTLKAHAPELSRWLYNEVTGGFGATALNVLKEIETQGTHGIDELLDQLAKSQHIPPFAKTIIDSFRHREAEWQALAIPALVVGVMLGLIQGLMEPSRVWAQQSGFEISPTKEVEAPSLIELMIKGGLTQDDFNQRMRNQGYNTDVAFHMYNSRLARLDPEIATRLYMRDQLSIDQYTAEMRANGYHDPRITQFLYAHGQLLSEGAARDAFLRNLLGQEHHDEILRHYGYTPVQIELMRKLYFYIPPVADLIHMGIRNVFNPEIVERFTLDGDYPKAFEDAGHAQGISSEWAHKYWQAHWIMPGREAFFEMFQRTTTEPIDPHADEITLSDGSKVYNIMGKDTLNLALRDIDTPPFYRDKLTQVAYRPITRIDIRRLNKVGILKHAGVERAYLDLGYSHEHARMLADFTEKLNATTTKNQAQTLVTNLQRHVIQLFIQDKLSAEQVQSTLDELGFTEDETAIFMEEAKLVRAAEFSTAIEAGIGRLYQTGRIPDTDAIQRLRDADVPDDAITTLMAKWDLAIEYRELPAHVHAHRELTAGEILESLSEGSIDEPTAETMLEDIGYDKDGADTRIGIALYRAAKTARRVQIDAIKASYVNGVIEQPAASNRLDALYLPTDQRDSYLGEWELARETRTERIPIATLRDMVKGAYLSEDQAFAHLKRHRYTDEDAQLLLAFWRNQKAPKGLANVSGS